VTRVLARLTDPILATVWRDLLVSAGIPAEVTGRAMNAVYAYIPSMGDVELIVRDEDYDEARRLLADVQAGAAVDDPDSPDP
jgi:hypothetical protein